MGAKRERSTVKVLIDGREVSRPAATKQPRFWKRRLSRAAAFAAAAGMVPGLAQTAYAVQYTYTPGTTPDSWTAGTDWNAPPQSAATSELTFVDTTGTTLVPAGQSYISVDDITGQFSLNILDLGGLGAASGSPSTITLNTGGSATGLAFSGTGAAINFDANAGTAGLSFSLNAPITLGAATVLNDNGSGTLNISTVALAANTLTIGGTGGSSTPGIITISGNVSGTGGILMHPVTSGKINTVILSGDQTATGGNYSGILTVQPTVAGTIAILSLRSTTAVGGAGIFLAPTTTATADSGAILEVGAKIGTDANADFAMSLTTTPGTAQAGKIAFQNNVNNFAGEGFAAWGTNGNNGGTLNNRVVALGGSARPHRSR